MIARYPGRCAATGVPIRPGDAIARDSAGRIVLAPSAADALDSRMPVFGLGRSRASLHRSATDRMFGAGLDHETE